MRSTSLLLLIFSICSGCSTIVNGRSETVSINSNVSGAQIVVNGKTVGTTPYNGPIRRGADTTITVSKDGYVAKTITADTNIEPIFWGNIILGGFLGSTTDASTGSMYKYSPATLQIDLEPAKGNG